MKHDLKLNFTTIDNIVDHIKIYVDAIKDIEKITKDIAKNIEEYQSKTISELEIQNTDFHKELKSCKGELNALYKTLFNYSSEMQALIKPVAGAAGVLTRVDKSDINDNLTSIRLCVQNLESKSIKNIVDSYCMEMTNVVGYTPDEIATRISNYNKLSTFLTLYNNKTILINQELTSVGAIYDNKIVKYYNVDKRYKKEADTLNDIYDDGFWAGIKDFYEEIVEVLAGIVGMILDTVVGLVSLGVGIVAFLGACIVYLICEPFGVTPNCVKKLVEGTIDTIGLVLSDPTIIIDGMVKDYTDRYKEKGLAYSIGYIAPDIILTIFSGGVGKVITGASKASKASKNIAKIAKYVGKSKLEDVATAAKTIDQVVDRAKAARLAEKAEDAADIAVDSNNTVKSAEDISDDVGTVVDDVIEGGSDTVKGGSSSKFPEVFDAADNYTLSDDTFNNHILERHGPNSIYGNKSHFNYDFDIKNRIDSTLKGDNFVVKSNTGDRSGYIFEQTFATPIGTNSKGKPLYTLKVVIDESGNVITAFPKK